MTNEETNATLADAVIAATPNLPHDITDLAVVVDRGVYYPSELPDGCVPVRVRAKKDGRPFVQHCVLTARMLADPQALAVVVRDLATPPVDEDEPIPRLGEKRRPMW